MFLIKQHFPRIEWCCVYAQTSQACSASDLTLILFPHFFLCSYSAQKKEIKLCCLLSGVYRNYIGSGCVLVKCMYIKYKHAWYSLCLISWTFGISKRLNHKWCSRKMARHPSNRRGGEMVTDSQSGQIRMHTFFSGQFISFFFLLFFRSRSSLWMAFYN